MAKFDRLEFARRADRPTSHPSEFCRHAAAGLSGSPATGIPCLKNCVWSSCESQAGHEVATRAKTAVQLLTKASSAPAAMRVRHGLTAETVIGALEDAEDEKAFEAASIADYDVQSAVGRELVLRLAILLWRLRRATTMETGLFEIQADNLREFRQGRQTQPKSQEIIYPRFGRAESVNPEPD